jgi:hypothetical protein
VYGGHLRDQSFEDAARPRFFAFQALRENPTGSPILGSYEVDPRTGDVWDGAACGLFKSPALGEFQRVIRKRIGLTDAAYKAMRTPGPMCRPDEKPRVHRGKAG